MNVGTTRECLFRRVVVWMAACWSGAARRFVAGLSAVAVLAAGATVLGLGIGVTPAVADGSRDLYPATFNGVACGPNSSSGACRAFIDWRAERYGPTDGTRVFRRTLLAVYLQSGEVLTMGSSAVGVDDGDIVAYYPGVVTDREGALPTPVQGVNAFLCSSQRTATGTVDLGTITTRAQELGGPTAADGPAVPDRYLPCYFEATTTGVYDVAFYGPGGASTSADASVPGDIDLAHANNTNANQGGSVAAWDLTVRPDTASTVDIAGRVFTYALALYTNGNGRPVRSQFYVTTLDGYRYLTDTNGIDGNAYVIYANDLGYRAPDGSPLEHDVLGTTGGYQMTTLAGGVDFAPPKYPW